MSDDALRAEQMQPVIAKIHMTQQFLTHVDIIDEQHRFMTNMFNRLVDDLRSRAPISKTEDTIRQLFDYCYYHFRSEEKIMEAVGYPDIERHKKQHCFFIDRLMNLSSKAQPDEQSMGESAQFLGKWFQGHILTTDRKLGDFAGTERVNDRSRIDGVDHSLAGDHRNTQGGSILREINVHKLWLAGGSPRCAELEFADMSGLNLDEVDLSSASLMGANLSGTQLRRANLSNANLTGADLEQADLTGANLTGADLRGANLHRALLTAAILRGADLCPSPAPVSTSLPATDIETTPTVLTEAKLKRAIFCNAKLAGCDFTGADLVQVDLSGADLSGAIMIGADLHDARLDGAILTGTVIELAMLDDDAVRTIVVAGGAVEQHRPEMSIAEFANAIKDHELWIESDGANGRRLDIDSMTIPHVKMTNRRLAFCRIRRCNIIGGEWINVDFRMSDFSFSCMPNINLEQSILRGLTALRINCTGANLSSTDISALPLAGRNESWPANFEGSIFRNVNLTGAKIDGAIMRKVNLSGANMDGVSVDNTDFEDAIR